MRGLLPDLEPYDSRSLAVGEGHVLHVEQSGTPTGLPVVILHGGPGAASILERAKVAHVGTHGIRPRAATDIANCGVSVKIGMALTAHKTAAMFMRYVHAEDDPVRAAAEKVTNLRRDTIGGITPASTTGAALPVASAEGLTSLGNYRPYRHRKVQTRAVPPVTKRASTRRATVLLRKPKASPRRA